ncbi:MAG: protein kinase [Bacteroidetes bacterium]|nr:protein kinase [Bacteroidota bacterium]
MTGKSLSHYEILSELGRGGMGIVYKAKDTTLNRTVAIKVLPVAALGNEDDKARFFREAQAAAQLHHSNIATVFAIEEATAEDGTEQPFIAMEYIEGDTLTERISEGPLKLDDLVEIATQVASALEAAHEKNIVHRDVKSGNVMLTTKGVAKVLDFGLAKTAQSTKLTKLGSTLGTIAYMSPEQARGEEVDKRSDLWSLGVLIYEMISGRLPYASEYEQAAVYSILNEDPEPLTALRTGVPMGLEWIVGKCLAKNPEERYQNATDLMVDLKAVDLRSSTLSRASVTKARTEVSAVGDSSTSINTKSIFAMVAVALMASLLTFLLTRNLSSNDQAPALILPIEIHSEGNEWSDFEGFDISPDGLTIVYSTKGTSEANLFLMHIGEKQRVELEGTSRARHPMFDHSGQNISFEQNGGLQRIPVTGGFPEPILPRGSINSGPGYSWTSGGDILYVPEWGEGIWIVSIQGGELRELISVDIEAGEGGFSSPIMLPDEKTIVAVLWGPGFNYDIVGIDIASGDRSSIVSGGVQPRYLEPGYLLYVQGDRLMAASFNASSLEFGSSVPVVDNGLLTNYDRQRANYAVSASGTLVYQSGESEWDSDIIYRSFDDESRIVLSSDGAYGLLRLSPDGKKVAYSMFTPRRDSDVYVFFLETKERRQLTSSGAYEGFAVWHPNSEYVYYSYQSGGPYRVLGSSISVGAVPDTLNLLESQPLPMWIHPDGRILLWVRSDDSLADLVIADPTSTPAKIERVANSDDAETEGALSPDGRFAAYLLSGRTGNYIYAKDLVAKSERKLVSEASRGDPRWSPSGRHLYYLNTGDLWKREHLGSLEFGPETFVLKDVDTYELWPDESGILTLSTRERREAWMEFEFLERLKEIVPPL